MNYARDCTTLTSKACCIKVPYWVYIGFILGLYWVYIGTILGLY